MFESQITGENEAFLLKEDVGEIAKLVDLPVWVTS